MVANQAPFDPERDAHLSSHSDGDDANSKRSSRNRTSSNHQQGINQSTGNSFAHDERLSINSNNGKNNDSDSSSSSRHNNNNNNSSSSSSNHVHQYPHRVPGNENAAALNRLITLRESNPNKVPAVCSVAYSPNMQWLAFSSFCDDRVEIWDNRMNWRVFSIDHKSYRVAFSPDSTKIASAGANGSVLLWEIQPDQATLSQRTLNGHKLSVYDVAWTPEGDLLASASEDCTIRLWSRWSGECVQVIVNSRQIGFNAIAFSPFGRRLAAASMDYTLFIYDTVTGLPIHSYYGHADKVWRLAYSPDGERLASSSADGTLRLWDCHRHVCLFVLSGFISSLYCDYTGPCLSFSPNGRFLACGCENDQLIIWSVADGHCVARQSDVGWSMDFAADGNEMLVGTTSGAVAKWRINLPTVFNVRLPQPLAAFSSRVTGPTARASNHHHTSAEQLNSSALKDNHHLHYHQNQKQSQAIASVIPPLHLSSRSASPLSSSPSSSSSYSSSAATSSSDVNRRLVSTESTKSPDERNSSPIRFADNNDNQDAAFLERSRSKPSTASVDFVEELAKGKSDDGQQQHSRMSLYSTSPAAAAESASATTATAASGDTTGATASRELSSSISSSPSSISSISSLLSSSSENDREDGLSKDRKQRQSQIQQNHGESGGGETAGRRRTRPEADGLGWSSGDEAASIATGHTTMISTDDGRSKGSEVRGNRSREPVTTERSLASHAFSNGDQLRGRSPARLGVLNPYGLNSESGSIPFGQLPRSPAEINFEGVVEIMEKLALSDSRFKVSPAVNEVSRILQLLNHPAVSHLYAAAHLRRQFDRRMEMLTVNFGRLLAAKQQQQQQLQSQSQSQPNQTKEETRQQNHQQQQQQQWTHLMADIASNASTSPSLSANVASVPNLSPRRKLLSMPSVDRAASSSPGRRHRNLDGSKWSESPMQLDRPALYNGEDAMSLAAEYNGEDDNAYLQNLQAALLNNLRMMGKWLVEYRNVLESSLSADSADEETAQIIALLSASFPPIDASKGMTDEKTTRVPSLSSNAKGLLQMQPAFSPKNNCEEHHQPTALPSSSLSSSSASSSASSVAQELKTGSYFPITPPSSQKAGVANDQENMAAPLFHSTSSISLESTQSLASIDGESCVDLPLSPPASHRSESKSNSLAEIGSLVSLSSLPSTHELLSPASISSQSSSSSLESPLAADAPAAVGCGSPKQPEESQPALSASSLSALATASTAAIAMSIAPTERGAAAGRVALMTVASKATLGEEQLSPSALKALSAKGPKLDDGALLTRHALHAIYESNSEICTRLQEQGDRLIRAAREFFKELETYSVIADEARTRADQNLTQLRGFIQTLLTTDPNQVRKLNESEQFIYFAKKKMEELNSLRPETMACFQEYDNCLRHFQEVKSKMRSHEKRLVQKVASLDRHSAALASLEAAIHPGGGRRRQQTAIRMTQSRNNDGGHLKSPILATVNDDGDKNHVTHFDGEHDQDADGYRSYGSRSDAYGDGYADADADACGDECNYDQNSDENNIHEKDAEPSNDDTWDNWKRRSSSSSNSISVNGSKGNGSMIDFSDRDLVEFSLEGGNDAGRIQAEIAEMRGRIHRLNDSIIGLRFKLEKDEVRFSQASEALENVENRIKQCHEIIRNPDIIPSIVAKLGPTSLVKADEVLRLITS